MIVVSNPVPAGRFGRDRSDRRHERRAEQVGGRIGAEHVHEVADRRRARERHDVDAPLEQHLEDVRFAFALGFGGDGSIRDDLGDLGAQPPQFVGDDLPADIGARQQEPPAAHVAGVRDGAHERFRAELGRRHVDLEAVAQAAVRPSPIRRRTASRPSAPAGRAGRRAAAE